MQDVTSATATEKPLGIQITRRDRFGIWQSFLIGGLLGLLWGASMRVWMRFISTDPEYTMAGTVFIIGASVLVGSALGLARHRRLVGGVGWWRWSIASLLLLGAGGAVMWPAVVLGAIAFARRRRVWLAVTLGVAALATQIPVLQDAIVDHPKFSSFDKMAATAWYLPMLAAEAWAFSVVFAPTVVGAEVPGRIRRVLIAAPVVAVGLLALVLVGVPGG